MAFKVIFVISAIVACVQAGGPAAYSISAPSIDHGSVGNSQEHTVKGHYGQNSQSDYSSQVTAGHAVSHVSRSSTTNDAAVVAPSYGAIAHSYAPAISHGYAAAPAQILSHGYAASAPILSHGYAAAAPSYISAGAALSHGYLSHAPATLSHSYAAPAYSSYIASAPAAVKVAAAPAYASGYISHAPAYSQSYVSAPSAYKIAAPAIAYGSHAPHGLGLAAAHYAAPAYAAPAYAAHAYAPGPIIKAAPALVHTSVAGHGIHYAY
ncbi:cuticle protein 21.3 isoform X2 [Eupeodes corollae]|uniref:cuticle protein 21.3 isoform X2 n=1 Tax=Eupeodes corollae TaxID=290404 RepID=UPI00248F63E4|nr:cuticle protein 21.3 isoform X2 [Eupeodes corollae]